MASHEEREGKQKSRPPGDFGSGSQCIFLCLSIFVYFHSHCHQLLTILFLKLDLHGFRVPWFLHPQCCYITIMFSRSSTHPLNVGITQIKVCSLPSCDPLFFLG